MAKTEVVLKQGISKNGKQFYGVYIFNQYNSGKEFTSFVGFVSVNTYKDLLLNGYKEIKHEE